MPEPRGGDILRTEITGVSLRNPVILASGTAGYLDELSDAVDLSRIGAVVTKSITARPRQGNKTWRIIGARGGGMLNAIGLANIGKEAFEREVAPRVAGAPTAVIGSIAGFSVEDYTSVAAMFEGVDAIGAVELNLSCPNVSGGMEFGQEPHLAPELVAQVRKTVTRLKLWVKLSPRTPDILAVAGACAEAGADALVMGNTFPAMAIDVETRRPVLSRPHCGLSGPAIHPIAVRLMSEVYEGVAKPAGLPVIGVGGVLTWEDAAELILAGASAVEMGTATFADPRAPVKVVRGLEAWARRQGVSNVRELVGAVDLREQGKPTTAPSPAPGLSARPEPGGGA